MMVTTNNASDVIGNCVGERTGYGNYSQGRDFVDALPKSKIHAITPGENQDDKPFTDVPYEASTDCNTTRYFHGVFEKALCYYYATFHLFGIVLMHDIELNPGPSVRDWDALHVLAHASECQENVSPSQDEETCICDCDECISRMSLIDTWANYITRNGLPLWDFKIFHNSAQLFVEIGIAVSTFLEKGGKQGYICKCKWCRENFLFCREACKKNLLVRPTSYFLDDEEYFDVCSIYPYQQFDFYHDLLDSYGVNVDRTDPYSFDGVSRKFNHAIYKDSALFNANNRVDFFLSLIMHDIELNPGPPFFHGGYVRIPLPLKVLLPKLPLERRFRVIEEAREMITLSDMAPEYCNCCLCSKDGSYAKIKKSPPIYWSRVACDLRTIIGEDDPEWFVALMLMHDIELNPGPLPATPLPEQVQFCTCSVCMDKEVQSGDMIIMIKALTYLLEDRNEEILGVTEQEFISGLHHRFADAHASRALLCNIILTALGAADAQMTSMFNNMRFEVPHGSVHHIPVDTKDMIKNVMDTISNVFSGGTINVNVDLKHSLGSVKSEVGSVVKEVIKAPGTQLYFIMLAVVLIISIWDRVKHSPTCRLMIYIILGYSLTIVPWANIRSYIISMFVDNVGGTAQSSLADVAPIIVEGISLGLFSSTMNFKNIRDWGKSICEIDKTTSSLSSYLKKLEEWIMKIVTLISEAMGIELTKEFSHFDGQIKDFSDRLAILQDGLYVDGSIDHVVANDVTILAREIQQLAVSPVMSRYENIGVANILRTLAAKIAPMEQLIKEASASHAGRTPAIVWATISHPGTGKTCCADIEAKMVAPWGMPTPRLVGLRENGNREMYAKPPGKFWSRYHNQWITLFNDFAQNTDTRGEDSDCLAIIQGDGTNDRPLNMPDLIEKKLTSFNSRWIILNSNLIFVNSKTFQSINNHFAFVRRARKLLYYQVVKKEFWNMDNATKPTNFARPPGVPAEEEEYFWRQLDANKLVDHLMVHDEPFVHCEYVKWDWATGSPDGGYKRVSWEERFAIVKAHFFATEGSETVRRRMVTGHALDAIDAELARRKGEAQNDDVSYPLFQAAFDMRGNIEKKFGIAQSDDLCTEIPEKILRSLVPDTSYDSADDGSTAIFDPEGPFEVTDLKAKAEKINDDNSLEILKPAEQRRLIREKFKRHFTDSRDYVPYLLVAEETFLGLHDFVKEYVRCCMIAGERLTWAQYDKSYKDDPEHPIHSFLEEINMDDLHYYVKWTTSDTIFAKLAMCHEVTKYRLENVIAVTRQMFVQVREDLAMLRRDPLLWFVKHPIIGPCIVGVGSGLACVGITYTVFGLVRMFCNMFCGSPEVVQAQPEIPTAILIKPPDPRVPPLLDSTEVDAVELPPDEVITSCLGDAQMECMDIDDRRYVRAKNDNFVKVALLYETLAGKRFVKYPSSGVFLAGYSMVTNAHTLLAFKMHEKLREAGKLRSAKIGFYRWDNPKNFIPNWFNYHEVTIDFRLRHRDMASCEFRTRCFNPFPHIFDSFLSEKCTEALRYIKENRTDIFFCRRDDSTQHSEKTRMTSMGTCEYTSKPLIYDKDSGECFSTTEVFVVHDSYEMGIPTIPGECCQPAYWIDIARRRFLKEDKTLQQPKIVYLHNSVFAGNARGILPLREDFSYIEEQYRGVASVLDLKTRVDLRLEVVEDAVAKLALGREKVGIAEACEEVEPLTQLVGPQHRIIGYGPALNVNAQNTIHRNFMYGVNGVKSTRFPAKTCPSLCDVPQLDGTVVKAVVDPALKGASVYGFSEAMAQRSAIWTIGDMMTDDLMSASKPIVIRRSLTRQEAIMGCPECLLPSINFASSPGYTFTAMKQKYGITGKGKEWLLGTYDTFDENSQGVKALYEIMDKNDVMLNQGIPISSIKLACVKQELVSKEKVQTGTSRLFFPDEVDMLIHLRMDLGAWIGWLVDNKIINSFAVGVNPDSNDWDHIYHRLMDFSKDCICGDFSKWDKKFLVILMLIAKLSCDKYYGKFDPIANKRREALWMDIFESIHALPTTGYKFGADMKSENPENTKPIALVIIYLWLMGGTSGNFVTTHNNSFGDLGVLVYCFMHIYMKDEMNIDLNDTNDHMSIRRAYRVVWTNIRAIVYGDDHAVSVNRKVLRTVDFYRLQSTVLACFGMDYTDEFKGKNGLPPPFKTLDESSFLARGFNVTRFLGYEVVAANLRLPSIHESIIWDKVKNLPLEVRIQICERAFREYSKWGPDIFEQFVPGIAKLFYEETGHKLGYTEWLPTFIIATRNCNDNLYGISGTEYVQEEESLLFNKPEELGTRELPISVGLKEKQVSKHFTIIDLISDRPRMVAMAPSEGETNSQAGHSQMADSVKEYSETRTVNPVPLNPVSCDVEQITCFSAAAAGVVSSYRTPTSVTDVLEKAVTIKSVLGRPKLIKKAEWDTSYNSNSNFYTVSIASLLTTVTEWYDHLLGFNGISGTFKARVELSAYPFQSGSMLVRYIPCYNSVVALDPSFNNRHNLSLISKFQQPHVFLDMRDTNATISVPYIAPTEYYGLKEEVVDWGNLYVDIASPLRVGENGLTYVQVSIYGWFEDVQLFAPSVAQSDDEVHYLGEAQAKNGSMSFRAGDNETKESKSDVVRGLELVSSAASSFSAIPSLAVAAKGVEWASRFMAGLASAYGWSKPRILDKQTPMFMNAGRYYASGDGPSPAAPMTMLCDTKLEVLDRFSVVKEDEMSLKFLLSVPTMLDVTQWETTQTVGTVLLSRQISPNMMRINSSQTHNSVTMYFNQGAPLYYLSNFFHQWTGGIWLILKFVKTVYDSGKLQITWTPVGTVDNSPLVTDAYPLRTIVDIREQDEVRLLLPYMLNQPWLLTQSKTDGYIYSSNTYSGQLDIVVLNDLRAPETCSGTVDIFEFYLAADDFEFAVPCRSVNGVLAFSPQSSDEAHYYGEAQMDNAVVSSSIGEMAVSGPTMRKLKECVGERVTSIKQFLNMMVPLTWSIANPFGSTQDFCIWPWMVGGMSQNTTTGAATYGIVFGTPFDIFGPMYTFMRGSMRVGAQSGNSQNWTGTISPEMINIFDGTAYRFGTTYGSVQTLFGQTPTVASQITPLIGQSPSEVGMVPTWTVPYRSRFPVSFIPINDGVDPGSWGIESTLPQDSLVIGGSQENMNTYSVYRSCGDDFQLMFFIGAPPIYTTQTS